MQWDPLLLHVLLLGVHPPALEAHSRGQVLGAHGITLSPRHSVNGHKCGEAMAPSTAPSQGAPCHSWPRSAGLGAAPTHPAGVLRLSEFKALLLPPPCSLPPVLDYSIRDYAFASSLVANWGLCQGQHEFQPVSLITVRPAHWKL